MILKKNIKLLKFQVAKMFNNILANCTIAGVIKSVGDVQQCSRHVENFIKLSCDLLEHKHFLCFYEENFKLTEQLDLVTQIAPDQMYC